MVASVCVTHNANTSLLRTHTTVAAVPINTHYIPVTFLNIILPPQHDPLSQPLAESKRSVFHIEQNAQDNNWVASGEPVAVEKNRSAD